MDVDFGGPVWVVRPNLQVVPADAEMADVVEEDQAEQADVAEVTGAVEEDRAEHADVAEVMAGVVQEDQAEQVDGAEVMAAVVHEDQAEQVDGAEVAGAVEKDKAEQVDVASVEGSTDIFICTICISPLAGDAVLALECGHVFHESCLDEYAKHKGEAKRYCCAFKCDPDRLRATYVIDMSAESDSD